MKNILIIFCICAFVILSGNAVIQAEEIALPNLESGKVVLTWSELKTMLDELESLKRAIAEQKQPEAKEQPPVEFNVLDAQLRGTAQGATMRFDAEFSVQILKSGWTTFQLLPAQVGIESVRVTPNDAAPTLSPLANAATPAPSHVAQLVRGDKSYDVIAQGPAQFTLAVVFYAPIQVDNLTYSFELTPPPAVMNSLSVEIPEKAVNLLKMSPTGQVTQADSGTTFRTVLSKNDTLALSWQIEKETGIARKSSADALTLVTVEKTALSMSSMIALNNLPSLEQVELHLPKDVDILNVSSADIERWTTEQTDAAQVIKLTGQIDGRKTVNLTVAYRAQLPSLPAKAAVPVAQIKGVELVSGFVGVEVVGNLDVTSAEQNKFMIPAKNLPKALLQSASSPLLYGYEFHEAAFHAQLDVKSFQEIQTVVANIDLMECVTHRTLEGKSITRARYFIRNNDRQFLTVALPEKSRLLQAFSDGEPVKPATTEGGAMLIPMKKSAMRGEELRSFSIEIGYVTDVDKLSLKGELLNELPGADVPISHLRWTLFLPENYEYMRFEGPVKQVTELAAAPTDALNVKPMIDIPLQGKQFLFEKYLLVDETPYVRGKYGQHLGDDIFLSVHAQPVDIYKPYQEDETLQKAPSSSYRNQQVVPNMK
ncbi:hypothetical protein U14_00128 [Candidatus Moduliflexus flocculans]|uniref:Uncharacterized protein n=1 Tax=Candidatus Moduliflexus flocculans TaxID=1499966 RepID=A0A0S6VPF8_9BACT|nr:hypothetical protein U14_00128 [Candidatus Moduliflexus flocculans]